MASVELGREYSDGEAICVQGEIGDRMFVVQTGHVEVAVEESGAEHIVGTLTSGDVFGEMAIFDRQPRSATVRAKGTVFALTLDRRTFMRRVHEDPLLAFRILESMSHRIRALDEEVAQLRQKVSEA